MARLTLGMSPQIAKPGIIAQISEHFVRLSNARATYHAARGVMIRRIMRRIANLAVVAAAVSVFLASEPHGPASCLCVELDTDLAWKTDCNPRTAAHQIEFGNIQLTDFGGVHFKLPLM